MHPYIRNMKCAKIHFSELRNCHLYACICLIYVYLSITYHRSLSDRYFFSLFRLPKESLLLEPICGHLTGISAFSHLWSGLLLPDQYSQSPVLIRTKWNQSLCSSGAAHPSWFWDCQDSCSPSWSQSRPRSCCYQWDLEEPGRVEITSPFLFFGCWNVIAHQMRFGEKHTGCSVTQFEAHLCYQSLCL